MVVETIVVAALHGAYGGLTWVACANSRGVAVFLVLWPMTYGLWPMAVGRRRRASTGRVQER
ncbi:hypothetical protein [Kocuria sp. CPCC 205297]|uniref:hypothetical protein n=1 Tax=Kocuria sp. CPCC 205297 TaxID=3073558 RepID=UPI0034D5D98D